MPSRSWAELRTRRGHDGRAHHAVMSRDCCRPDYDALFDARSARRELEEYRRNGAGATTRRLLDAIIREGVEGAAVLDIGSGVGVIGLELLGAGADRLTNVDASRNYIAVATHELRRRGFADRATLHHGDFVVLADQVPQAEVVTLNRVVCCYPDWRSLTERSVGRARRLYGLVYPRDRWFLRLGLALIRSVGRLFGTSYPFFVHPEREVDALVRSSGFEPILAERGFAWQIVLYRRAG
jgi:Methyltransferase domain